MFFCSELAIKPSAMTKLNFALAFLLFLLNLRPAYAEDKVITTGPNVVDGACSQLLGRWVLVDGKKRAPESITIEQFDHRHSGGLKRWVVASYGFGTRVEVPMDGNKVVSASWDWWGVFPLRVREVSRARVTSSGRVVMDERNGSAFLGVIPLGGTHKRLEFDPKNDRFDLRAHENAWQLWNPTTFLWRNARNDRGRYERRP